MILFALKIQRENMKVRGYNDYSTAKNKKYR